MPSDPPPPATVPETLSENHKRLLGEEVAYCEKMKRDRTHVSVAELRVLLAELSAATAEIARLREERDELKRAMFSEPANSAPYPTIKELDAVLAAGAGDAKGEGA